MTGAERQARKIARLKEQAGAARFFDRVLKKERDQHQSQGSPKIRTRPKGRIQKYAAKAMEASVIVFILESRHTRTADEPGKASPGHAMEEQFTKLTRAANAERWPEQLEA
jgi:hypothetical protein